MQQPQCIFHVFPISCSPILSYDVWHFWENFDHYFSILMVNEHIPESKIEQPNFSKARKCQVSEMLRTELDSTSVDTGKEFDQKKGLFTRKTDKVQRKMLVRKNQDTTFQVLFRNYKKLIAVLFLEFLLNDVSSSRLQNKYYKIFRKPILCQGTQ